MPLLPARPDRDFETIASLIAIYRLEGKALLSRFNDDRFAQVFHMAELLRFTAETTTSVALSKR